MQHIQRLNQRELDQGISINASWHAEFKDTAYIYFGSLAPELNEGDVLCVFSQYGVPVHLKLVRDKETGKSRGFGWLKYEDARSCVLAVDNLNGSVVLGRKLRVDHAWYEERDRDEEYEALVQEALAEDMAVETKEDVLEEEKDNGSGDVMGVAGDDEFADPLLLMASMKNNIPDEHHHQHRHRSERRSDKSRRDRSKRNRSHERSRSRHRTAEQINK